MVEISVVPIEVVMDVPIVVASVPFDIAVSIENIFLKYFKSTFSVFTTNRRKFIITCPINPKACVIVP